MGRRRRIPLTVINMVHRSKGAKIRKKEQEAIQKEEENKGYHKLSKLLRETGDMQKVMEEAQKLGLVEGVRGISDHFKQEAKEKFAKNMTSKERNLATAEIMNEWFDKLSEEKEKTFNQLNKKSKRYGKIIKNMVEEYKKEEGENTTRIAKLSKELVTLQTEIKKLELKDNQLEVELFKLNRAFYKKMEKA